MQRILPTALRPLWRALFAALLTFTAGPAKAQPGAVDPWQYPQLYQNRHFQQWWWMRERQMDGNGRVDPEARRAAWEKVQAMDRARRAASTTPTTSSTQTLSTSSLATTTSPATNAIPALRWSNFGPAPINNGQVSPSGPVTGRVTALAADPTDSNRWFLGACDGGVWRTTDGGTNWTPVTDAEATTAIGAIAIAPSNPNIIYVGTGEENFSGDSYSGLGVLKSTDGGNTWTLLASGTFSGRSFIEMTVNPTDPTMVVAASSNGVYRTTDGGTTWSQVQSGAPATTVRSNPSNYAQQYAGLGNIFGNTNNGVYRSTNSGANWSKITGPWDSATGGVGRITTAIAPTDPNVVYVCVQDAINSVGSDSTLLGIWKTTNAWDATPTWTQLTQPVGATSTQFWYDMPLLVDRADANSVYFGGVGLERFDGTSWTQLAGHYNAQTQGTKIHPDQHALAYTAAGRLLVGNDGGCYSTTDNSNFATHNNTLSISTFYFGSIHPGTGNLALGGCQDNGTSKYTGSNAWDFIFGGDGADTAISPSVPLTHWATSSQNLNIVKTTNGSTFSGAVSGLDRTNAPFIGRFEESPDNEDVFIAGTASALYRCNNFFSGTPAWTINNSTIGQTPTAMAFAPGTSSATYAIGGTSGALRLTTDSGTNWTDMDPSSAVPNFKIGDMVFKPGDNTTIYVVLAATSATNVYRGTGLGGTITWTNISVPASVSCNAVAVDPTDTNTIYVGTNLGLWRSSDGGSTWAHSDPAAGGIPNVVVSDIEISAAANRVVVFTHGRGAFINQTSANPVITLPGATVAYTENDPATVLDSTATVTDSDSADFNTGTLTVDFMTNGATEDRLSIRNVGTGTGQIGVSGSTISYEGATIGTFTGGTSGTTPLVVTFTSASATPVAAQALVRNLTYQNVSDNPSTATRTIRLVLTDGDGGTSTAVTKNVTITAVNDAPTLVATVANLSYTENQGAAAIDTGLTVSDVDSANLTGGTVAISAGFVSGDDLLGFTTQNGITGSYSSGTGVLTLSGTATVAQYQTALRSVTYTNSSDTPTASRTITFTASDGLASASATRGIAITAVNDPPVIVTSSGSLAYTEKQGAAVVDPGLTLSDVDSTNIVSVTVSISLGFFASQDSLGFVNQGGITGSYSSSTGVLTLSGSATVAAYQAALRTVTYTNSSSTPTTSRTITFSANDGSASGGASRSITITPVNDPPVVTATASALAYLENQGAAVIDSGISLSDADNTSFTGATVSITAGFISGQDALGFTNQGGISGTYSAATGVLTLTGTATVGTYQTALRSVTYTNSSDNPTASRTITFSVTDGQATTPANRAIGITAVNDAPTLAAIADPAPILPNSGAQTVNLTGISAGGGESQTLTVTVTGNTNPTLIPNPTVTYTSPNTTGTLNYTPAANSSGTSVLTVQVADDGGVANGGVDRVSRTFTVTIGNGAPVVTTTNGSASYTENAAAVAIDSGVTISDFDSSNLVGGSVAISGNFAAGQDTLAFTNQNGITGSYSAASGVLTLTGSASLANYQAALRTVTYANSSDNPSTALRTVTFTVNDGASSNNLGSATRTLAVTAVNDAPVVTTSGGNVNYTENQAAVAIDGGLTVADVDSATLVGATVGITANFAQGEDVLAFTASGGVSGSYNATTGVLTLSGTAAPSVYATVLRSVTYLDTSENPSAAARTLTFTVDDGATANRTGSGARTVTVTPVNDPPVVVATAGTLNYVENQAPTIVDGALSLSDVDSGTYASATVTISANFVSGEDVLSFQSQGGITGSYNGAQGILTLSGTAAIASYQSVLRSVRYANTSDNPSGATRTVTFAVDDGGAVNSVGTAARAITVTPVNDPPVIAPTGTALVYTENQPSVVIDGAVGVTDVDNSTLVSATVTVIGNFVTGQDVLGFTNQGGIVGSYNPGSGQLTLSGNASVSAYQAALRSVTYFNTSDDPSAAARTIEFAVDDGAAVNHVGTGTRTVSIITTNDPPVLSVNAAGLTYTENQAALPIDGLLLLDDPDSPNLVGATVAVSANFAAGEDVLGFSAQAGITGTYNAGTGILSLSGSASLASYRAALRSVTYFNSSDNPSTAARTITMMVDDGSNASNTASASRSITVTAVNDPPSIVASVSPLTYVEKQGAALVEGALNLTDPDSETLVGAKVSVAQGFAGAEDSLGFTAQSGITGSYNAGTGTLSLSGSATVAAYEAVLRSVTYLNSSANPAAGLRSIRYEVDDGAADQNVGVGTRSINVVAVNDAPEVTASVGSAHYTENQAAVSIDSAIRVADVDSTTLTGAAVAISGGFAAGEDVLSFTPAAGITGSYDGTSGVLTLSGTASLPAYEGVLQSVTYRDNSDNPSAADRTVTFTVNDGGTENASGSAARMVTVTAVNDAPTLAAISDPSPVDEDAGVQVIALAGITAGGGEAQTITIVAESDNPSLIPNPTVTYASAADSGSVSYKPVAEAFGAATVTVTVRDDGGTANGGVDTVVRTFHVQVNPVNDPPSFTKGANVSVRKSAPAQSIAGWATDIRTGPPNESDQQLSFAVTVDNPALFSIAPAIAVDGTLTFTPTPDTVGSTTVTVTSKDNGGGADSSESATFTITVTNFNLPPSFVPGSDVVVSKNSGDYAQAWASAISAGSASEAGQALTFSVTNDNAAVFATPPTISATGVLSFAPAAEASGVAVVTVRLQDDGGTANGAVDTTPPMTFRIAVATWEDDTGLYTGLIRPAASTPREIQRYGSVSAKLTNRGKFTAKIAIGRDKFSVKGDVDLLGHTSFGKLHTPTAQLARKEGTPLELTLTFDTAFGTDSLAGAVQESGNAFATLAADRALYTAKKNPMPPLRNPPAELISRYTALFPARGPVDQGMAADQYPQGDGFAFISVSKAGVAVAKGTLADGQRFSAAAPLSKANEWPLHALLAKKLGVLNGAATFRSVAGVSDADSTGFAWVNAGDVRSKYYPSGWPRGIDVDFVAAKYARARGDAALPFLPAAGPNGNATVTISGAFLSTMQDALNVDLRGASAPIGQTIPSLRLSANKGSGGLNGSFMDPATGEKVKAAGVILDQQRLGSGFFLSHGQSGRFVLAPRP